MIQRFADWLIYVVSGILLGMAGGIILGRMHLEPLLSDWVRQMIYMQKPLMPGYSTWNLLKSLVKRIITKLLRK